MKLEYRWCKDFQARDLEELFLSLDWSSGRYPDALRQAMLGSDSVHSAWVDGRLAGLMNALSDGAMTVYFHYLLVRPEYQRLGIGKGLVEGMLERYSPLYVMVLNSYEKAEPFYRKCGFTLNTGISPLGITNWAPPV